MKTVTIKTRSAYGNLFLDPMCYNAKTFARMLNKKTLTRDDLFNIAALGFQVIVENGDKPEWLNQLCLESV